ncbi:MAG: MarR family transcriptional regulator [Carnobacterium sp.]|uniref:MarR family winged helix-turn-helix transcriptional regulator n=1 Tax=Carnobacterium sp. TaxID=48221 RepID=UPI003315FEDE
MVEYDFIDRPTKERVETLKKMFPEANASFVTLFLDIQWTYRGMQKQYDIFFERYGLTETKFIILMFLYNEPSHQLLPSILSEKLGSTRATITKVTNGLERNNWIIKKPSSRDKRSVIIQLTHEGEALLENFLPENYRAVSLIMSTLDISEQEELVRLLNKIKLGTKKMQTEMELNSNENK